MAVGFYNADLYVISLGGVKIHGFADGEFLTVKPRKPKYETVEGVDGEIARGRNSSRSVIITVKILQTSASNLFLSSFLTADMASPNGKVAPFLGQDISGNSIVSAAEAWVVDFAESSFDRGPKAYDWTIETGVALYLVGGNH